MTELDEDGFHPLDPAMACERDLARVRRDRIRRARYRRATEGTRDRRVLDAIEEAARNSGPWAHGVEFRCRRGSQLGSVVIDCALHENGRKIMMQRTLDLRMAMSGLWRELLREGIESACAELRHVALECPCEDIIVLDDNWRQEPVTLASADATSADHVVVVFPKGAGP